MIVGALIAYILLQIGLGVLIFLAALGVYFAFDWEEYLQAIGGLAFLGLLIWFQVLLIDITFLDFGITKAIFGWFTIEL